MYLPFAIEFVTAIAAGCVNHKCFGVLGINQWCACPVPGFCSAQSRGCPVPWAFTHSLCRGDGECRNEHRKQILWGRKCHIRSLLGLAFDRKGPWKNHMRNNESMTLKEREASVGLRVGEGKEKQWMWSTKGFTKGWAKLHCVLWMAIDFPSAHSGDLQVLLLLCPTAKSSKLNS